MDIRCQIISAVVFAVYAGTTAPTIVGGDAGELVGFEVQRIHSFLSFWIKSAPPYHYQLHCVHLNYLKTKVRHFRVQFNTSI